MLNPAVTPSFQRDHIVKPMGWVIDMRHYLDEETSDLPDGLPTPALNLALFGSIVAWVTDRLPRGDWHTNVPCRRSPADAAWPTSWPNVIAPQDTSHGSVPSAVTA